MKVILLQDVAKIGKRFAVVDVPDGFALNKLIPKKLAAFATVENLKRISEQTLKQHEHQESDVVAFKLMLEKLSTTPLVVSVEANKEGRLFQALKAELIAETIKRTTGDTVQKENIISVEPIKTLGTHMVTLVLGKEKSTIQITVNQVSQ